MDGPDKGAYYHELFVQGRPILCTMMKRNKIKGVKNSKATGEGKSGGSLNTTSAKKRNGDEEEVSDDDAESI